MDELEVILGIAFTSCCFGQSLSCSATPQQHINVPIAFEGPCLHLKVCLSDTPQTQGTQHSLI